MELPKLWTNPYENDSREPSAGSVLAADDQSILQVAGKEYDVLKKFLLTLQREKKAILSFSLPIILYENGRKEELLNSLVYLKSKREYLLDHAADVEEVLRSDEWQSIMKEMERAMKEAKTMVRKNIRRLSFATDHVRSSIEHIVDSINRSASLVYGRQSKQNPILLSRRI
jgi:hypothetical protein